MIDTDKYEGHIQGEWRDTRHEGALAHHIYARDVKICTVFPNEATANLVTDSPLLLAEFKRLRKENKLMVYYFRRMRDGGLTDEDWRTINEWIGDEEE